MQPVLCGKIIAPCPAAAPAASGSSTEGADEETGPEDLEPAVGPQAQDGGSEGTQYIENKTVELDSDSSFEL